MATIQETTLINKQVVLKFTPITTGLSEDMISAAMYIAQDMHLEQYLGTSLMAKLKADVNSWAGEYLTLMEDYIPKCLSWWTMYHLYPMMYIKHDNGGLYKRTAEDTETISGTELANLKAEAKSRAESYTQRLIDYLCANAASIPEYNNNQWPNKYPKKNPFLDGQLFTRSNSATSSDNQRSDLSNFMRPINGI